MAHAPVVYTSHHLAIPLLCAQGEGQSASSLQRRLERLTAREGRRRAHHLVPSKGKRRNVRTLPYQPRLARSSLTMEGKLLLTRTRHRAVLYWFVSGRSDGTAPSPPRPSPSTSGGETPKRSSKKSELLCPTCLPLSIHCAVRLVYAFILTQCHLVHCVLLYAQEQARAQLHPVGAKRRRLSVIRPRAMRARPRPKRSEAHLVSLTFSLLCSARPPRPPTQPHLRIHAFAHSTSLRRSCAPRCHSLSLSHSRLLHSCSHALCSSSAGIHPSFACPPRVLQDQNGEGCGVTHRNPRDPVGRACGVTRHSR